MNEKMKVVWLCHFRNKEIQDILHPRKRESEKAPWILVSLRIAEQDSRFEFHVVAPHPYISGVREFELRGIYYHFFNPYIPFIGYPWPRHFRFDYITNFWWNKRRVRQLVTKIQPDVIHLFGAENPYYSSTILPLVDKYPTILTIQGFISHTTLPRTKLIKKHISIEQEVIRSIPVCFFRSKTQAKDTREYNPDIELIPNVFGSYELKYDDVPREKKYDIVFFARICKDKGIDDLLVATSKIKQKKPDVSLCIIGSGRIEGYKQKCQELGISDNVIWLGFLPTRKDVHLTVAQSKISVLPTYHDILPGTIIESMFLGVPMVTYDVDSNPEINEDYEAIRLVKAGDTDALASALLTLLQNDEERELLSAMGKKRAYEMFAQSDKWVEDQWMEGYTRAIEIFRKRH